MPNDSELRDWLRSAGLRATRARLTVLRVLVDRAPTSHPEVTALLGDGWDRSTLYRNLVDLHEAGLLRRVELGDHVWRYELATHGADHPDDEHPHFLCTACGDVSCLPEMELPSAEGDLPRALSAGHVQIQIRGLCDRCLDA